MDCPAFPRPDNKTYLRNFYRNVVKNRVPLSGSIELTSKCNMKCVHCYLPKEEKMVDNKDDELTTRKWMSVIDEITNAGCLYLLITGGEPLLRPDFTRIYEYARRKGMVITVFTNGTLISDEIVELFKDFPPNTVEVSLYGATKETYEAVTRIKGSYKRCIAGIKKLYDNNIHLKLKTVLMTLNQHELDDIKKIAGEYQAKFRFDASIFPRFNGDLTPLDFRLCPEEIVKAEFSDPERLQEWHEYHERTQSIPEDDRLYKCSAGSSSFHIDGRGNLKACLMDGSEKYNLMSGSFMDGWEGEVFKIREKSVPVDFLCKKCDKIALCGYCPPFSLLEKGSEYICSEFLCQIGNYRFKALEKNTGIKNENKSEY